MNTRFLPVFSICVASLAFCLADADAAPLVGYNFTGGTVGTLTPATSLDPTTAPPTNVTATAISVASGLSGSTFQDNSGNIDLNMLPGGSSSTTEAGAVASQYIEFTLDTPSASFGLDLDTLTLDLLRGGSTGDRNLFLRTSLDGYTANISPGVVTAPASSTLTTFTFADTPLYNSVQGSVTFRLYTYNSAGINRSVRVDNIVVDGAVIPEPTTFAMLLGGLGIVSLLRRRRH